MARSMWVSIDACDVRTESKVRVALPRAAGPAGGAERTSAREKFTRRSMIAAIALAVAAFVLGVRTALQAFREMPYGGLSPPDCPSDMATIRCDHAGRYRCAIRYHEIVRRNVSPNQFRAN